MTLLRLIIILAIFNFTCSSKVQTKAIAEKETSHSVKPQSKVKKIIFIIGDGMGLAQVSASMYSMKTPLALERCTYVGIQKSYSANDLITDSAAGATAFSIGKKTNNGYLGMDADSVSCETILEEASRKGMATGMVVSSTIVHATPAAFIAHNKSRDAYEEIALDMLDSGCDFLIGGGEKFFNRRSDSMDLIKRYEDKKYFVTDYFKNDYSQLVIPEVEHFMYFTADGDPLPASMGRDYVSKASLDAIHFLDKKNNGFFLMIEGSQIDWGGHANDLNYVLEEMKDFNTMLNAVLDWAEKDGNTLVVITADHETGGLSILPDSKMGKLKVNFSTTKHTACLIPVYAYGPGAMKFSGIYENTEIYYKLKKFLF